METSAGQLYKFNDQAAKSIEEVKDNFRRFDLLTRKVKFLKGWFHDTLKDERIQALALIRLDGDMYESTMSALEALYPKLSVGGYIIIDDYNFPPTFDGDINSARKATDDFRVRNGITEEMVNSGWCQAYWRKNSCL
jgi:O-methyltransferase